MRAEMEKYLGHVGPVSGHTFDMIYDLVFTNERLIAVNTRHPTDETYAFQMTDLLIGRKLAQKGERMTALNRRRQPPPSYESIDLDTLIQDRRHCFAVPYAAITAAKIARRFLKSKLKIVISNSSQKDKTLQFTVPKKLIPNLEELLATALPGKSNPSIGSSACPADQ